MKATATEYFQEKARELGVSLSTYIAMLLAWELAVRKMQEEQP